MLSRSIVMLAQPRRVPPFSAFYGKMSRLLTRTKGPLRMKVTGALWTLIKPKNKQLSASDQVKHAMVLYNQHGNSVLAKGRALKRKELKIQALKKTKRNAKLKAKQPLRGAAKRSKGSDKTVTQSLKPKKVKKAGFGKKPAAKGGLQPLNRNITSGRPQKLPPSLRLPLEALGRRHGTGAGSVGVETSARRASYDAFRTSLIKRGNLKPSGALNQQIHRLWRLTSTQTDLSDKAREYMALRLIKKSLQGSRKVPPIKKKKPSKVSTKRKAVQRRAASNKKNAPKMTGRSKEVRKGKIPRKKFSESLKKHRAPYLKFYRAMVLTGCIPNHPKGVRSRVIKELWYYTNHLKTLSSRIKLGTAFATGAQKFPETSRISDIMTKKVPSEPIRVVKSAKDRLKKPLKPFSVKVPLDYKADPFLATYRALLKYIPNKTVDARMRTISKAWIQTDIRGGKDIRTPEQRIQAVANKLGLM